MGFVLTSFCQNGGYVSKLNKNNTLSRCSQYEENSYQNVHRRASSIFTQLILRKINRCSKKASSMGMMIGSSMKDKDIIAAEPGSEGMYGL